MKSQKFTENIETTIAKFESEHASKFGEDELTSIKLLSAHIVDLKKLVKSAKQKKQSCARLFKDAKDDPEKFSSLKSEMNVLSNELGNLETSYKEKEEGLAAYFQVREDQSESDEPLLPAQFLEVNEDSDIAANSISVSLINDSEKDDWDDYVASKAQASIYHYYDWKSSIEDSFGHRCFYLVAKSKNSICGVLPLIWLKSKIFGSYGISVPFFNYGGPLADSPVIAQALLKQASEIARSENMSHLEIRTTTDKFDWPSQSKKVSMILKLPKSEASLDETIGTKLRAQIKQALPSSPQVSFGGLELLNKFYRVFSENMRDLGTPVYGKDFFENLLRTFKDAATLVVVEVNGRPVACAFLLGHKDLLEIPWASTLRRVNPMNINMWMYRQILGFAINNQFRYFDFGRSTRDSGTYRFKKQWGACAVDHFWYYWMAGNEALPNLSPDNPKFKLAIMIWKKLPLFVTNLLGPILVKNLP